MSLFVNTEPFSHTFFSFLKFCLCTLIAVLWAHPYPAAAGGVGEG
jgi:hypothetical protein